MTLFAALNCLDGKIIGRCAERHGHANGCAFLKQIDRADARSGSTCI